MIRKSKTNIEHVLPANPKSKSDWVRMFGAEMGRYSKSIGNLFVAPEEFNGAQLRNADWSEKKPLFKKHLDGGGLLVPLGDMLPTGRFGKWNTSAVDQRHQKLRDVIKQIWGF